MPRLSRASPRSPCSRASSRRWSPRTLSAGGVAALGLPFSDPVMDGAVIQEASRLALEAGATPERVLATVRQAALGVPVAVMTYANPVWRLGHEAFLHECVGAGVSGVIVPDLPVAEAAGWGGG